MLEHCVFCDIPDSVPQARIDGIVARFAALVGQVPGMTGFSAGINRDFEAKSGRYRHGFICRFTDRTAHLAYENHPEHQAAGAELVSICTGGHAGIIVFDLEVADPA